MKRISLWFMSTLSALVLLFSYHTSTEAVTPGSSAGGSNVAVAREGSGSSSASVGNQTTTSGSGAAGASGSGGSEKSSNVSHSTSPTATSAKTYLGNTIDTRWGPVQVQITVVNGKITASDAVQHPNENGKDVEINSYAVPQLNSETVAAQSAHIDMVSGASYTSNGYIESLQSALDQAKL